MSWKGPILVPVDGSELAERAVVAAAELARRAGTELRLVHVHVPLTADPIYVEGLPVIDEHLHSRRREHEQAYLERAQSRLAAGVAATTVILEGDVAATLADYARTSGAALVVMTTHGRGGLERAWLGSVADELTRISPVPLLVLRPGAERVPADFRRILVPLDQEPLAESVLEHAAGIARLHPGCEIVLLEVVQPVAEAVWMPDPALIALLPTAELVKRDEERARAHLADVARRLEADGLRARARVEVAGNLAAAIIEAARAEQADMIALATHGRSGPARLAVGSVADKVLRGSPAPVLLYRPAEARPPSAGR